MGDRLHRDAESLSPVPSHAMPSLGPKQGSLGPEAEQDGSQCIFLPKESVQHQDTEGLGSFFPCHREDNRHRGWLLGPQTVMQLLVGWSWEQAQSTLVPHSF